MNKTSTAAEFLSDNIDGTRFPWIDVWIEYNIDKVETILECMKEFAKLHVTAALEAAANNSVKMSSTRETILKSYPLTNIK